MSSLSKQRVAANFSRAASEYEQVAVLQKTVADRLLERLDLVKIAPRLIIDAGAGTGYAARQLARRYRRSHILQLDLSPAMLQRSRRLGPRLFSRHAYLCADMEQTPLANACSQMLFSSLALQWCNNLDQVFSEIARLLQANGLLMFATLGPDTLCELRQSWAAVDERPHVNLFLDMHDVGDALVRAGFENVVMDVETITLQYVDCRQLMRDIKQVGATNASDARARGLTGKGRMQRMIDAYENHRHAGRLPASYEVIYGHAWVPLQAPQRQRDGEVFIPAGNIRRAGR